MRAEPVTFRAVTPADFGLLATWLGRPHVARWWNHEFTAAAVDRDFGPSARGEEPNEDLLVLLSDERGRDRPVGLVQRSYWHDYPEYVTEIAPIMTIPADAVTIDYLIGDPADTGRGLGPTIIAAVAADTWRAHPRAGSIIVPVAAGNRASWRALEKAGFVRIAEGDLPPDNPIDPPLHVVYRLDRPAPAASSGA
ncbi:GNAT family N-acetyltransferase [Nakamurella multipartita]|jgi:aminoglycoside 6'-N-acetyltransferase|uniref:Acetyltransferase n=1 Tax=Nakamurella multipartita (strain ATCC 700099 / DSM 44233 / CIP 104796 / JCM 9543 / NBRC 105858 / Y-104) TaxID=479431 RepID=C8X923_NAKMY|nr:acetyltransferase [Nakamurella multipartita DSM 44233]